MKDAESLVIVLDFLDCGRCQLAKGQIG